jgi:hypothetical protein
MKTAVPQEMDNALAALQNMQDLTPERLAALPAAIRRDVTDLLVQAHDTLAAYEHGGEFTVVHMRPLDPFVRRR